MTQSKHTPGIEYNSRYVAYTKAQGARTCEEMLVQDSEKFPGGKMAGFICWIQNQWNVWEKEAGRVSPVRTEHDHIDFDDWLNRKAGL